MILIRDSPQRILPPLIFVVNSTPVPFSMSTRTRLLSLTLLLAASSLSVCAQTDRCEDCELMLEGMPTELTWSTALSGPGDPGEPLSISGTIFKSDGKTPAAGVILYIYHTDKAGKYSPSDGQTSGKRHGHLRGWMKTDDRGRYAFTTIRPGSYPNSKNPQHIHPIIKESGKPYYWIDDFLFDDDPLLPESEKQKQSSRGGMGVIHLKKNSQGVWTGTRNIVLGKNIPGYR